MSNKANFEEYIILKKNKIKISSKEIKKGDVFIALKGEKYHGNKFIVSTLASRLNFVLQIKYISQIMKKSFMLKMFLVT